MKALFTRISLVAALALSAVSASACPLPNHSQTTAYEKGAGYYWRTVHSGYPHLMVFDGLISQQQKTGLRVSCSVMEETLMFGGRFAVDSIGYSGRRLTADVELPGISVIDTWDLGKVKPVSWQQETSQLRSSTVASSIAQILSHANLVGVDTNWKIVFHQDDNAGVWVKSHAHRERLGRDMEYAITFTGDFRTPAASNVVIERIQQRTLQMMVG